jgi:hypothetical protein
LHDRATLMTNLIETFLSQRLGVEDTRSEVVTNSDEVKVKRIDTPAAALAELDPSQTFHMSSRNTAGGDNTVE